MGPLIPKYQNSLKCLFSLRNPIEMEEKFLNLLLSKKDLLDKIAPAKKSDQNQCHFCCKVFQSQLGFSWQKSFKYTENMLLLQQ